jgi:NAD(P)-dependent dehydrogenase (short-subunit alcohol dehydrogenase family)
MDVTSSKAIEDAVQRATDSFGRIDVVINNAAYSLLGDTEATTDQQARTLFETVFWGAATMSREAVRVMREVNPKTGSIGGIILYMSTPGDRVALPGGSYYFAASVVPGNNCRGQR